MKLIITYIFCSCLTIPKIKYTTLIITTRELCCQWFIKDYQINENGCHKQQVEPIKSLGTMAIYWLAMCVGKTIFVYMVISVMVSGMLKAWSKVLVQLVKGIIYVMQLLFLSIAMACMYKIVQRLYYWLKYLWHTHDKIFWLIYVACFGVV